MLSISDNDFLPQNTMYIRFQNKSLKFSLQCYQGYFADIALNLKYALIQNYFVNCSCHLIGKLLINVLIVPYMYLPRASYASCVLSVIFTSPAHHMHLTFSASCVLIRASYASYVFSVVCTDPARHAYAYSK